MSTSQKLSFFKQILERRTTYVKSLLHLSKADLFDVEMPVQEIEISLTRLDK